MLFFYFIIQRVNLLLNNILTSIFLLKVKGLCSNDSICSTSKNEYVDFFEISYYRLILHLALVQGLVALLI